MDQAILVIYRIGDGRKLIEQLARDGFEILAAFWLYTNDNQKWALHLVSEAVESDEVDNPYQAVLRAFQELPDLQIDPLFDFVLLGPSEPLARGVLEYLRKQPSSSASRVEQTLLGDVYVESAYIYPPSLYRPTESAADRA